MNFLIFYDENWVTVAKKKKKKANSREFGSHRTPDFYCFPTYVRVMMKSNHSTREKVQFVVFYDGGKVIKLFESKLVSGMGIWNMKGMPLHENNLQRANKCRVFDGRPCRSIMFLLVFR